MIMRRYMRVVVLLPVLWVLASCVPMPQRVKEEFSRYDGERPNNFLTGAVASGKKEAAQEIAE